jgi:predicted nucleic acid-binding protein
LTKKIIVDSSPLIVLLKSDLEYILPELFEEIIVPESVWQEILAGKQDDIAKQKLPSLSWIKQDSTTTSSDIIESFNLGKGETAVLNLALTITQSRVMLDDFAARKCAKLLEIPFLGTGGALILAKQKGLISSVSEALARVQNEGLWLSDEIIELIKQKAVE